MGHAPPRNRDDEISAEVQLFWTMIFVCSFVIAIHGSYLWAGILVAVPVLITSGAYLTRWMQNNALTHTDEYKDQRIGAWAKRELPPVCDWVGHEEEDGKCIWCNKVLNVDALPKGEQIPALEEKIARAYAIPPYITNEAATPLTSWDQYYEHAEAVKAHYEQKR